MRVSFVCSERDLRIWARAIKAHRQHARDMKGGASVPSLIWWRQEVPSATIERRRIRARARQAAAKVRPSRSRYRRCRRHSRTRRPCRSNSNSMVSTFRSGISRSTCSTGLNAPKDFWWQWPCTHGLLGDRRQAAAKDGRRLGLAHQKFLEQQSVRADGLGRRRPSAATAVRRAGSTDNSARGRRWARRARRTAHRSQPADRARCGHDRRDPPRGKSARSTAAGRRRRASEDGRDIRRRPARAARRRDFRARKCG